MKKIITISIFLMTCICFIVNGQTKLKRYDVKSGMVEYTITTTGKTFGTTVKGEGTENLYFKDWGAIERLEEKSSQSSKTNILGHKNSESTNTHTMSKLDNGESYHVDFDRKKIFLRRDLAMDMTRNYQEDGDAGEVGRKMLEDVGGEVIGTEEFLGYTCELWDVMGAKQWMYKGVVLKLEMTLMGITTLKEAKSAVFNTNVGAKYFELPDFPIQKEDGYMDNEEFENEEIDMEKKRALLSNMSFEEWKKLALADKEDTEMQNMSETELRETYEMVQTMLKLRKEN